MTKKVVKEIMEGLYIGKIIDIDIYCNQYNNLMQATVLVLNKHHLVEEYIVDESGYVSFTLLSSCGEACVLRQANR